MEEEGYEREDFSDIKRHCKEFFVGGVIKKIENTIAYIETIDSDTTPHVYWDNVVQLTIDNLINYCWLVVLSRNDKGHEKGLNFNDIPYIKSNEKSCLFSKYLKSELINDLYTINRKVKKFHPVIKFTKEGCIQILKDAIDFFYLCQDARKGYYSLVYLCITIHEGKLPLKLPNPNIE